MNTLFLLLSTILILFANIPNISLKCPNTIRDVVFIIDLSESRTDKDLAVEFFTEILKTLKASNARTRFAFFIFGKSYDAVLDFNTENSTAGNITGISKALNFTLVNLFPKMRNHVDKLIIVYTDGTNQDNSASNEYALKLKSVGVRILSIGIGSHVNSYELWTLSTSGSSVTFDIIKDLSTNPNKYLNYFCFIIDSNLEKSTKDKFDLVFILDSSKSISEKDFNHAKQFIIDIVERLNLKPDRNRVAVITFSDNFRIDLNFADFKDFSVLIEKIKRIEQFGNLTGIGKALEAVQSKIIPQKRSETPINILLITDGTNNIYPRPFQIADSIKKEGANIITVGVGSDINIKELDALSSNGQMFTVGSFNKLEKSLEKIINKIICDNSERGTAGIGYS